MPDAAQVQNQELAPDQWELGQFPDAKRRAWVVRLDRAIAYKSRILVRTSWVAAAKVAGFKLLRIEDDSGHITTATALFGEAGETLPDLLNEPGGEDKSNMIALHLDFWCER